jgi:cell fate regulator YaaT (PSP1 superfamily)
MVLDDMDRDARLDEREYGAHSGGDEEFYEDDGTEHAEVIFKANRRGIFRNTDGIELTPGMFVIVEADKGEDLGRIGMVGDSLGDRRRKKKSLTITREAGEGEIKRWKALTEKEKGAFEDFRRRVERREMSMKPVDVEYQFDGKKIRFYFTADHRVDFRELVRELAGVYRTRIELRQIGVRDEAKRIGGIGPCGRELCCSTFMGEFAPISSQMARDQNLSLNPSKLSGLCGRLKCCLRFEHDFYRVAQTRFPKLGSALKINGFEGIVNKVDFFKEVFTLRAEDGEETSMKLSDIGEQ